jgi:uncharacterized OsmC-like protein
MPDSATNLVYNRVKTSSSGTAGRSIGEVRQHYFVADDPAIGEAMTAADFFVSGIAACAANHMELKAHREGLPLQRIQVALEARRDQLDTSVFLGMDIHVRFFGTNEGIAQTLLDSYRSHCPLYKTVAAVTTVTMTWEIRD